MRQIEKIAKFIVTAAFILFAITSPVLAQTTTGGAWEDPQWIPGLVDIVGQAPYFVADPSGDVHVFHSQWLGENYNILYSHWATGVGWSLPVDIVRSPFGQARITGATLDNEGMVSLTFWGGNETGADIYFTQAPLPAAGRSTSWSVPVQIGRYAITPTTAAMITDGNGYYVVAYSGNEDGQGIYGMTSTDGGKTWSDTQTIFLANSDLLYPSELQLYQSADQNVHAVWALGDTTGNSIAVHYARLDRDTGTWTRPTVLAKAFNYEADTPSIIEHDDSLIVIYHNDFPTTRFMIRSFDGGDTWTSPVRLFEHVGSNGPAALIVDSSDTLRMFFGNRIGTPATHGLWHSTWANGRWTQPDGVVTGPSIPQGDNGEEGFDPTHAQAVITQGNTLLVIWRQDPAAGPIHIWYSYRSLDAPQIPTKVLTWVPSPTAPTPEPQNTPTPVENAITPFAGEIPTESGGDEINSALLIGIGPAVILILVIIVLKQRAK